MPNHFPQPVVIRCPLSVRCNSKHGTDEIVCEVFGAVKTEVLKADLCPEARSERHARETAERFEDLSQPDETVAEPVFSHDAHATGDTTVDVDTHIEVTGDENDA